MAPPSCAPAPRPAYSVLGHNVWANTGLTLMRDWDDARTQAVAERALEPIG
ncbi:dTDP-4-dehydrorhamnose reductase [Cryobacterium psychrotolerans]|nr:dTDP-4-dehydrorhamnose reductase [Cryobacterium psychrotolerans]